MIASLGAGHAPMCGRRRNRCCHIRVKRIFHAQEVGAGLVAAATTNPRLLDPLRERFQAWQQAIESDGIEPARATVIRLAVDGSG